MISHHAFPFYALPNIGCVQQTMAREPKVAYDIGADVLRMLDEFIPEIVEAARLESKAKEIRVKIETLTEHDVSNMSVLNDEIKYSIMQLYTQGMKYRQKNFLLFYFALPVSF